MSNSNLELNDLTKYRLDEINKIKEYFNAEFKERKDIIKKNSKYIVAFDHADKVFITLSASSGTLSISSYATVVGIPAGIAGASLTLIFTITTGVVKTFLNIIRKKKKKHNKIIALARSKLNIIENLISQALIDFEITHGKFSKIIYEKNNFEQIIDNIRSVKNVDDLNKENDQINISIIKDTMLSYCLKCKRNTESINPKVSKAINSKAIILLTCAICGSKKSKFIKQQEEKGLLSNLGLRTPLNKIPVLEDILF